MKKNIITTIVAVLFICISSYAQKNTGNITGKVITSNKISIPYVNVIIKSTSMGTITNSNGDYELKNIPYGNYTLKFSLIGMQEKTIEVLVNSQSLKMNDIQLNESQENLSEVIITANRSLERIDEVPSSVSVLNSTQIKELQQTSNSTADILNTIPGVAFSTNKTSSTGQTLRGRNMLILIDGIPQSTPLRNGSRDINSINPDVIERIEIIKGATSIYGNGSSGGIVNYITKTPNLSKKFESSTTLGSDVSLVNVDETVGSSLTQSFSGNYNKLSFVTSGTFKQTGVFRDAKGEVLSPTYGLGETNQYNLFGKIKYQLNDKNSIQGMYNYFSSNQNTNYISENGTYGVSPTIGVIGEVLGVDQGNRYNHNAQIIYNSEDIFTNTDLNLNLYLQEFQTVYGFSDYFYNALEGYEGGQSQIESSKKGARLNFNTKYSLGDNFDGNIVYGLDYLNDNTSQTLVDGRVWVPQMDMKNFAPYLQVKSKFSDIVFKAGIRFENIKIGIDDYKTIYIFPYGGDTPSGNVNITGGSLDYNATVFNAGIRYNGFNKIQPFVSFSQSFSIADLGRTLRNATANTVESINSEAVITNNYEIGFDANLNRIKFTGAGFISTSDLGSSYVEVDNIFQILREPEKVYGFELGYTIDLTKNLKLGGSYSYTEGKFDSDENKAYINGDRIPPLKIVNYLQYKINNKWNAKLTSLYSGSRDRFEANDSGTYSYGKGPVDSFKLFNLNANYHLTKNTKLGLGIENLFNEDYYPPISQWNARDSNYIKGNGTRMSLSVNITL